jgi:hypothetical protein
MFMFRLGINRYSYYSGSHYIGQPLVEMEEEGTCMTARDGQANENKEKKPRKRRERKEEGRVKT